MNYNHEPYTVKDYQDIAAAIKDLAEPYGGSLWDVSPEHMGKTLHDLPNRLSEVCYLHEKDKRKILRAGKVHWSFTRAEHELYNMDPEYRSLVDFGKPEHMRQWKRVDAPFKRGDATLTLDGPKFCEWGFNANGMPQSNIIDRGYTLCGKKVAVPPEVLKEYLSSYFYTGGTVAFTDPSYDKQFKYLASELLSTENNLWDAQILGENFNPQKLVFPVWQECETEENPHVLELINKHTLIPFPTHHEQGKIGMAALYDREWGEFFLSKMGESDFDFYTSITPLTYILNGKRGLSKDINKILEEKDTLSVLKVVDGPLSFGSKGVYFLNDCSRDKCISLLTQAMEDPKRIWILQAFHRALKRKHPYFGQGNTIQQMDARTLLRVTYGRDGEVLSISAIHCPGTDYLHGMATAAWVPVEQLS